MSHDDMRSEIDKIQTHFFVTIAITFVKFYFHMRHISFQQYCTLSFTWGKFTFHLYYLAICCYCMNLYKNASNVWHAILFSLKHFKMHLCLHESCFLLHQILYCSIWLSSKPFLWFLYTSTAFYTFILIL